jgi:signal transduction histidine kinase
LICVSLVEMLGGHIDISSAREAGTTIRITLPVNANKTAVQRYQGQIDSVV